MKQNKKEELSLIKHKTEYWKTMKVHTFLIVLLQSTLLVHTEKEKPHVNQRFTWGLWYPDPVQRRENKRNQKNILN